MSARHNGRRGRNAEAATQFERAAALADNDREREVLSDKAVRIRGT
ncbi:hypothetical protein [Mycobacterium sp. GA-2829]|nr:hypothetical protein [Mycobacterium sp. GA-2829]